MDTTLISDEQLSALELMMQHADDAHVNTQGAPKRKRKRKSLEEMFPDGYELYEEYVGTGSRAANRERKAKTEPTTQPDNRAVVEALETAFAEQSDDSQDIIKAVNDSTVATVAVSKALSDWLKWSQERAFLEDHKTKTEASVAPPAETRSDESTASSEESDSSSSPEDFARDRNGRRTRRRRYRSRTMRRLQRFGKSRAGKIAGIVALGAAGLGIGSYLKDDTSENLERNGTDVDQTEPAVTPVQEVPRTPSQNMTDEQVEEYNKKRDTQDLAAASAGTGAMLLGGAKRIPGIGAAVSLADGAYNSYQISNDINLTDAEKSKEQTKNIASTGGAAAGATMGAWAGGIVGSIVPFFGTAIGATLGGLLGGYLGDTIGEYVGEKITAETDEAVEVDRKRREQEDRQNSLLDNSAASKYAAPIFMPMALGGASPTGAAANFNYGMGGARFPGQTSQRANDIAKKVLSSEKIGGVSEQFESGGRGVGTVSSGSGDYGGVSYGKHQLASSNGSMSQFLASQEAQNITSNFAGLTPGTASFNERYRQVAATHGKEMEDAQYKYLVRTHYAPTAEKLEKEMGINMDDQGRAFKEMVYSTSMQYGGNAASKIQRAFRGKDFNSMTEQERLEAVQQDKLANVHNDFRSSSVDVQQGVAARTQRELDVLKKVHEGEEKEKQVASVPSETKPADVPRTDPVQTEVAVSEPSIPKSFEDKTIEEKQAQLASMRDKKDFLQRKVDYIKAHPEVTRADEKRIDEIVREQQRQAAKVSVDTQNDSTVVRAETIGSKEQPNAEIARAIPLEPLPQEPVATQEPVAPDMPKASAQSSGSTAQTAGRRTGSAPSLDDIPVILDDPMMNMINIGYV